MSIFFSLSSLALRQVVEGACAAVGLKESGEAVVGFLTGRFTDQSQRLTTALRQASDNAWKALEIALAGDSLWDRCKSAVARAEERDLDEVGIVVADRGRRRRAIGRFGRSRRG